MRKLATIRKINNIRPIEGADSIEVLGVDGWEVVSKKGEFNIGDMCLYFEIDSWIPNELAPFLSKGKEPRVYNEIKGERLRTVRLRGQISQGLILPITDTLREEWSHSFGIEYEGDRSLKVGDDLTGALNIQKWEAVIPAELAGQVRGNFPSFIPKTAAERCQNLGKEIFIDNDDSGFEITTKLDGTSFTAYQKDSDFGVCGRNWNLTVDDSNAHNTLVRMYIDSGLQEALRKIQQNYAVQGELMGPGISKNREAFSMTQLFVFNIYDIDNQCFLSPYRRHEVMAELWKNGVSRTKVHHAPVIAIAISLNELNINNMTDLLEYAKGPSIKHPVREGLVFKRVDGGFSFKVINNVFLEKEKD